MPPKILIADDEKNIREGIGEALSLDGFAVSLAADGKTALSIVKNHDVDLIITDLKMPRLSGMELITEVHSIDKNLPIIILTGHGTVEAAVDCMRKGAYDFLMKPVNLKKMSLLVARALSWSALEKENALLHHQLQERYGFEHIIGHSLEIKKVFEIVETVAPTKANILITGESGTGKELIANALHTLSDRSKNPFIKVHCSVLATGLLESELFGHEKGAFTGALARKKGRFELADSGTIFLDEIGDIDANIQVKLLRVLQEKAFERVGGENTLSVDVRIITATNKDLLKLVEDGTFREDLYYRLNVVHVNVPSLRERKSDIPLLADAFIREFCKENKKKLKILDRRAMAALEQYNWPGNVREFKNFIENLVVMVKRDVINLKDLPENFQKDRSSNVMRLIPGRSLEEYEKDIILSTLASVNGNKSKTAEILGIGRKTLHRKLDLYNKSVS
ncbi:MAG: sigma-54-dependent Fis family transcriptional regulator [Spirochaetes bacterium]|nr:sigma-54-dependent Fis family transcriptional regulator [Spirochaetota bacterium]